MKLQWKRQVGHKKSILLLLILSLLVAFIGHFFLIYKQVREGTYLTGQSDNLVQMLSFKQFLYEQFKTGNFFYSSKFGLGGDFFSSLSYYYSTSIVFFVTSIVVWVLELLHIVNASSLAFWGGIAVFISVIRMALVIAFSTLTLKMYNIRNKYAFLGASLYALSTIYFRHVALWEPFADAFLWLPIIILGIEKIIQEKKYSWFIVGIALTLFNNFYFAYINILFAVIYIVLRWFIKLTKDELPIFQQIKAFAFSGVSALLISSPGFFPFVYGFFNTSRPPYEGKIDILTLQTDIFISNRTIILPMIFLFVAFNFICYKDKLFAFFSVLTLALCVAHYSPFVASVFNGFSAPQYRWEYILAFTLAVTISRGLQLLLTDFNFGRKELLSNILSLFSVLTAYFIFVYINHDDGRFFMAKYFPIVAIVIFLGILLVRKSTEKYLNISYLMLLLGITLLVNINYQKLFLYEEMGIKSVNKSLINNGIYSDNRIVRDFIGTTKKVEKNRFYRVDFRNDMMPNYALVEGFNGTGLYSSLLNKNIYTMYTDDLKINIGKDIVSHYLGFNSRANLMSIYNADYVISNQDNIGNKPYGYEILEKKENLYLLENQNKLNFIHPTKYLYNEKDIQDIPNKERAMLNGVIVDEKYSNKKYQNKLNEKVDYQIVTDKSSKMINNRLTITDDNRVVKIKLDKKKIKGNDLYVSFSLRPMDEYMSGNFSLNEFKTTIQGEKSYYGTHLFDQLIRINDSKLLQLKLPKGSYDFKIKNIYSVGYHELEKRHKEDQKIQYKATFKNNRIKIDYDNKNQAKFLTIPVPYENGWHLKINGKKRDVIKSNYAQVGFFIGNGDQHIEMKYVPPYLLPSPLAFVVGLLGAIILVKNQRKSK